MHFFLTKKIQAKSCDGQEVEGHGTQSENGPGAQTLQRLGFFLLNGRPNAMFQHVMCFPKHKKNKFFPISAGTRSIFFCKGGRA